MKKQLLFSALLFCSFAHSQSLDATNEPVIGQNSTMYVCDTLTDPYSSTLGSSVTWDYSQLVGITATTKVIEVINPASTAYAATFPASTKAFSIQGALTNFFNSTATERVSQGFVYEEPNFGTVLGNFSVDQQMTVQYPFSNPSYFMDNFSGTVEFDYLGVPQTPACTGVSHAYIDGQGTLLLPSSTSIPNVIRYKIVDTVFTQIFGTLDIQFVHTEYQYYDVSASSLPLFIHTTFTIETVGGATTLGTNTIVLSYVPATEFLGVTNSAKKEFTIFPNPSEGIISFKGDFDPEASATIYDQTGRIVNTFSALSNGQSVNLSHLTKGLYLVVIENKGDQTTNTVVIR